MKNKSLFWIAGIAAIVVIGIVVIAVKNQSKNPSSPKDDFGQSLIEQTPNDTGAAESADELQGTLKLSDSPAKGNLMLVMPNHIVYLRTSRDYAALLDKPVTVKINGSLETFQLVDISLIKS
jgi:hypothetical protein